MAQYHDRSLPRPAIPLLLQCGVAFWLGCLLSESLKYDAALSVALCSLSLLVLFAFYRMLHESRSGIRLLAVWVLFLFLGSILMSVSIYGVHHKRNAMMDLGEATCAVRILEDPSKGSFGYSVPALLTEPNVGFIQRQLSSCKVMLNYSDESLEYGDEFIAKVSFSSFDERYVNYFDKNGIVARCSVSNLQSVCPSQLGLLSDLRLQFASAVSGFFDSDDINNDAVALIKALVVGDRRELFESDFYNQVKVTGLAHLVAVSGAHLVIVIGLVSSCVRAIRLPRTLSVCIQLGFLFAYLVIVGFPVSCIRAAVMAGVGLLSFVSHKRSYALSSLGAAIIALMVLDPSASSSVSFALSALSTLGIIVFSPLLCSWIPSVGKRFHALAVEPFSLTFSALILTFPLSMCTFSQFAIISPFSNIVAVPLVTVVCALGVLSFLALPIAPIFHLLIQFSYFFAMTLVYVVDALSAIPFAALPIDASMELLTLFSVVLCLFLWLAWPRAFPAKTFVCFCIALMLCSFPMRILDSTCTSIVMLDVGQGDSFLIKSRGSALLIDTGNNPKKLFAGLARHGVNHLDGIVISHADDDHCGCLADLRGVVSVDSVFVAKGFGSVGTDKAENLLKHAEGLSSATGVHELAVDDVITVGSVSFRVISPDGLTDEGENDDSVCLMATTDLNNDGIGEWRALFTGDAESEVLDSLYEKGALEDIDILKVSHHGAKAALDNELMDVLKPEIALISAGERNRYGHPAANTISLLESCNVEVFRTDLQGDVVCILNQANISIRTMK